MSFVDNNGCLKDLPYLNTALKSKLKEIWDEFPPGRAQKPDLLNFPVEESHVNSKTSVFVPAHLDLQQISSYLFLKPPVPRFDGTPVFLNSSFKYPKSLFARRVVKRNRLNDTELESETYLDFSRVASVYFKGDFNSLSKFKGFYEYMCTLTFLDIILDGSSEWFSVFNNLSQINEKLEVLRITVITQKKMKRAWDFSNAGEQLRGALKHLQNLKYLEIIFPERCNLDLTYFTLSDLSPKLKHLGISGLEEITSEGLSMFLNQKIKIDGREMLRGDYLVDFYLINVHSFQRIENCDSIPKRMMSKIYTDKSKWNLLGFLTLSLWRDRGNFGNIPTFRNLFMESLIKKETTFSEKFKYEGFEPQKQEFNNSFDLQELKDRVVSRSIWDFGDEIKLFEDECCGSFLDELIKENYETGSD